MKYITTDKHPELKEGLVIQLYSEGHAEGDRYSTFQGLYIINEYQLNVELENDYIKKAEEKEFTRSELIEICYIRFGGNRDVFIKNLNPIIDEWKRQKDK